MFPVKLTLIVSEKGKRIFSKYFDTVPLLSFLNLKKGHHEKNERNDVEKRNKDTGIRIGTLESRRKEDLPLHWTIQERINQSGTEKIRNKCFIHPKR